MKTLVVIMPLKVTIFISFHSFNAVIRTFGKMVKIKIFQSRPFLLMNLYTVIFDVHYFSYIT